VRSSAMGHTCQAKGCGKPASHWWRVGDVFAYLCSDCKLAVQTPWRKTPELEAAPSEEVAAGGDRSGDGKPGVRTVPGVPEVDADEGE
jgi:hypothetical protein